jgi:hypothetical protein
MYKAYVSPGWEQQIMPYIKQFRLQLQLSHFNGREPDRRQV